MHMSYPFRNDAYLTKLTSARNLNGRKVLALEELPNGRWKCQPEGWKHTAPFLCVKPENLDRLPGPDTSGRTGDALEREGFYRQMRARSGAPVSQPEPRFLTDEEKAKLLALGNPNETPRCAWNELSKRIKAAHGGVYPDDWHRMVNLGGLWQPVTDAHVAADEAQVEAAAAAIADKFGIRDSTWARERTNRDLPPEQQAPRKAVLDVHAPPSHPVKPGTPLPKALQDVLKSGGAHDVFTTALRFYQAKVLGMVCEPPYNGAPLLGFEAETDKGVEVVDGFLVAYFDEGTQKMLTLQLDSLLDKQFHCMSSALTAMIEAKDPGRGARAREEARAIAASIERAKATVAAEEPPLSPPCSPPESEDEGAEDVHPPPEGEGGRLHRIGESEHFEFRRSAEGLLYVGVKLKETPDPVILSTVPRAVVSSLLEQIWEDERREEEAAWAPLPPSWVPAEPAEPDAVEEVTGMLDTALGLACGEGGPSGA